MSRGIPDVMRKSTRHVILEANIQNLLILAYKCKILECSVARRVTDYEDGR